MAKIKFEELPDAFTNYFDISSSEVHSYKVTRSMQNQEVTTFQDLTKLNVKDQLQLLARNDQLQLLAYGINYHKK